VFGIKDRSFNAFNAITSAVDLGRHWFDYYTYQGINPVVAGLGRLRKALDSLGLTGIGNFVRSSRPVQAGCLARQCPRLRLGRPTKSWTDLLTPRPRRVETVRARSDRGYERARQSCTGVRRRGFQGLLAAWPAAWAQISAACGKHYLRSADTAQQFGSVDAERRGSQGHWLDHHACRRRLGRPQSRSGIHAQVAAMLAPDPQRGDSKVVGWAAAVEPMSGPSSRPRLISGPRLPGISVWSLNVASEADRLDRDRRHKPLVLCQNGRPFWRNVVADIGS